MQLTMSTNIKDGSPSRCCEEDRNIDKQSTQPPTLRSSGRGMQKRTQQSEQQVGEVGHQMTSGFDLDRERKAAAPDRGQQFFTSLNGAFGPAMLLRLEAVHVYG